MDAIPGRAFIAPIPQCPVHGQMKPRAGGWACVGWDGEGCDHEAPEPELTPIGHIDTINLGDDPIEMNISGQYPWGPSWT